MAKEAEQKLIVGPAGFPLPPSRTELTWLIIAIELSSVDCITSAARREMAVIQHHAKAQPRQTFLLPTNYNIHPSERTSLLSRFLQLAPHSMPLVLTALRH